MVSAVDRRLADALAPVVYLGVGAVVLDQLSQTAIAAVPDPGSAVWRFQVASMFVGRVAALALALLGLAAAGWWLDKPVATRVSIWGFALLAAGLVVSLVVLWVDGPAVKDAIAAAELSAFILRWIRSLSLAVIIAVVSGAVAIAGRKRTVGAGGSPP